MSASCARCGYPVHDFCGRCGEPLCDDCLRAGCCGQAPALSGAEEEFENQLEAVRSAAYGDLGLPREEVTCR
jgi:hypothetical protein